MCLEFFSYGKLFCAEKLLCLLLQKVRCTRVKNLFTDTQCKTILKENPETFTSRYLSEPFFLDKHTRT